MTVINQRKTPELKADWEALERIFIRPEEHSRAVLVKYMEQILFGLHDFLRTHVGITRVASLKELSDQYINTDISKNPRKKLEEVIQGIITDIAPHAVNVASPYFIGHMTGAIPFFMVHLATIVTALNQNVVKLETSKVVSIIERQVLAKIHRYIYGFDASFYNKHVQLPESTLGSFVEDGTLANLTALWVARNTLLPPLDGFEGVEKDGMAAAYQAHRIKRCVILVSALGHYSLRKAGGILGIGNKNVIPVDIDEHFRMDLNKLKTMLAALKREPGTAVMAIIGVAGTTETGTIDPLEEIAAICAENRIYFHVDAAWGGPVLLSEKYQGLLKGIKHADSVTIDGHKQFYMPMSCGMVYFKDPQAMDQVAYNAAYVIRPGSVDLGRRSLPGSRAAVSLILGSALDIMGTGGYALLLDHGIETAAKLATEIKHRKLFQLTSPPCLNILTYRLFPENLCQTALNRLNIMLQRQQRENGHSFVSRTTIRKSGQPDMVVLRAVIMNPLTRMGILTEILDEQEAIYHNFKYE